MTDTNNQPTEEQVKAANEAEVAKWEGDFDEEDLSIPYKAAEDNKDEEETDDETDKDSEAESTEKDDTVKEEPVEEEVESLVTVENPGEYTPADYSFEVTLADGKTVKVKSVEQAEEIGDDPDNFETPKQLMQFLSKVNKMERNLDRDYEKWSEQKNKFDQQSEAENNRQQTVDNIAKEFKYLEDKGMVPKVAAQYRNADWTDPEVADQPGVKEQIALLDYMVKENKVRAKAGLPALSSMLDVFNAWELENSKQAVETERKAAGEARKAAGSRVAATSPASSGTVAPKGIAVGNPNALRRGAAIWDN